MAGFKTKFFIEMFCFWPLFFIGMLCLTYAIFISIINNARETDIELTSCRQTLSLSTSITPGIAKSLMRIEAAKEKVSLLPVNPTVLASLRETAKLYATHYSTMIEGNQLKPEEIKEVIQLQGHFPLYAQFSIMD